MPDTKAVVLRREVYSYMPHGEEFGEVGFTPEDRKLLYTLVANEANLRELFREFRSSFERRMELIETDHARRQDIDRVEREIRRDLGEKANRSELSGSALVKLTETVETLQSRVTWAYAYASGIAAVFVVLAWFVDQFFSKR